MRRHLAPTPPPGLEPGPVPSFSIIVAAYNAATTIGEAIASALDQTVAALEIVVCDDGSDDDLEGALAPYGDRVRLIAIPHGGAAAARNAAAREARGEFVSVLDADDLYLPERLEALGELAAARPDLDILTTDARVVQGGFDLGRFYDRESFVVDDQRLGILRHDFILGCSAVRRERLLAVGGFDTSLPRGEDRDCWLRLIFAGAQAGLVDEALFVYRLATGSRSADRVENMRAVATILERARTELAMDEGERRVAGEYIAGLRREILLAEADAAVRTRASGRRRLLLAVAREPSFQNRTRAKAVASAFAPRLAERRLARREDPRRTRLERPTAQEPGARDMRSVMSSAKSPNDPGEG